MTGVFPKDLRAKQIAEEITTYLATEQFTFSTQEIDDDD